MSSSAIGDRGLILQPKGKGVLFHDSSDCILTDCGLTHRIMPIEYSLEGSITLPSLSTALERLKVARMVAAVNQKVEKAI